MSVPYRLAIFDFDGTLADSSPFFLGVVNDAAERYGFRRIEHGAADGLRGLDARGMMAHLRLPAWKLPLVVRYLRGRMADDIAEVSLFAGVDDVLRRLASAGVEMAIVSSNSEANVRRVLGPENAAFIGHYGCGASLFGKRPVLRKVLRAARVRPANAICIGDEIRDADAARAEGIAFGAVGWGFTRLDALAAHAPADVFTRVGDIAARLALDAAGAPAA
ncbi:MAG TPA: HAD hydrolase-like protein [Longimicrobiaceae bacterium]|jgi:phosphoglycolate phosphatase|nr:HAD hydrolase-like protein [Longimicrobiaceae bacterium]